MRSTPKMIPGRHSVTLLAFNLLWLSLNCLADGNNLLETGEYQNPSSRGDKYIEVPMCMAFTKSGKLFLMDKSCYIFHWNKDREFVNVFAGQGEGPGQLSYPGRIAVNDTEIWVAGADKTVVYDHNGKYLKEVTFSSYLRNFDFLNDQFVMQGAYGMYNEADGQTFAGKMDTRFFVFDKEGVKHVETLILPNHSMVKGPGGRMLNKPFAPEIDIQVDGDGVMYLGFSESSTIYKVGQDGQIDEKLEFALPTGPPSDADLKLFENIFLPGKGVRVSHYRKGFTYESEKAYYTHFLIGNGKIAFILTPTGSIATRYGWGFSQATYRIHDLKTKQQLAVGKYALPEDSRVFFENDRILACIVGGENDYQIVEMKLRGME